MNQRMSIHDRSGDVPEVPSANKAEAPKRGAAAKAPRDRVPEIYQVVIECRHEREQRAVFERMRGEGYRCRVLTL
jgi:hypothetical protein